MGDPRNTKFSGAHVATTKSRTYPEHPLHQITAWVDLAEEGMFDQVPIKTGGKNKQLPDDHCVSSAVECSGVVWKSFHSSS
ncbi:uncharacterized protein LAJ45_03267 [Morchella importuna]|uniref:uncharacterized protein n=1 Tax=Morchella importuna TaxID=1174673 RepID=UPI001E8E2706|nr:uncharacterized protein LAJ45_03267 [Morchella importuna]KAH8152427.1 hypothetical protein LAJ45_03267 [Morchella importuna]